LTAPCPIASIEVRLLPRHSRRCLALRDLLVGQIVEAVGLTHPSQIGAIKIVPVMRITMD